MNDLSRDLKVLRDPLEETELLIDIRDFITLFHVVLRRKFSERLESSIESALGMRFETWSCLT